LKLQETKKLVIDFQAQERPVKPKFLGTRVFSGYSLAKIAEYIDWSPFFQVWSLRGKYPNRGYPKLFNDPEVGGEARKVFNEANALLKEIIENNLLEARGIVGFYPANSVGDDIELYTDDDDRTTPAEILYGIRQQADKYSDEPFVALGDFIAPKESGIKDYIGLFAVCSGFGVDELVQKYQKAGDDYNAIMVEALADRLAEAFAEILHLEVRKDHWGYSPDEELPVEKLLKVKYRGIRPACGYPSQPDHSEKSTLWRLMDVESQTSITLSESLMMIPAAAVCGLYLANEKAEYFGTGPITKEQVEEYASRKSMEVQAVENLITNILGYKDD
jgi:5-methyltetrahydrofolate--homocysteine methyltransferase